MPNGSSFTKQEWAKYRNQLSVVDSVMKELAKKYKMSRTSDVRGYWPSRGLKKRKWTKVYRVWLSLKSDNSDRKETMYELYEGLFIDWWFFKYIVEKLWFNTIAEYSAEQINDRELMMHDLEKLLVGIRWE